MHFPRLHKAPFYPSETGVGAQDLSGFIQQSARGGRIDGFALDPDTDGSLSDLRRSSGARALRSITSIVLRGITTRMLGRQPVNPICGK